MASRRVATPLPLVFYRAFLGQLLRRGDVQFITYDDLNWGDDFDYKQGYPAEWKDWISAQKSEDAPKKSYVLIQHDIDSGPKDIFAMTDIKEQLGVRSSIMTFARWQGDTGEPRPYPVNWDDLKRLQQAGFCIGYHCNALQNARFELARVCENFNEDVRILSQDFDLKYFSPHGGPRGPGGEINASVDYPATCGTTLRWVHNRFSPKFHAHLSDGGLTRRLRQNDMPDPRNWLTRFQTGRRYRALIHPQYYSDERFEPLDPTGCSLPDWYVSFIQLVKENDPASASDQFWMRMPSQPALAE